MVEFRQIVALALFFAAYLGCSGGALWLGRGKKQVEDHALKHGTSGEQRVERTLRRAGYTVLTDLTVRQGKGTHQIDHIVCGQDRLCVLEIKTWHGTIEGRAGDQSWTLRRPRNRSPITVYNPLFQNQTHAEIIGAITRAPVTPLVISAGFIKAPPEIADRVVSLAGLPAMLGPPGAPTGRMQTAFEALAQLKTGWNQKALATRHKRWMTTSRRFNPVRALWVASAVSLACAVVVLQRALSG